MSIKIHEKSKRNKRIYFHPFLDTTIQYISVLALYLSLSKDVNVLFIIKFRLGMSLTKQKDSLIRERDRLTTEVDDLNKKLQQQRQQTDAIEKRRLELEEKCRELYKLLDVSV